MCNSKENEKDKQGLMGMLGLAARAGKLVYGTPLVCESIKKSDKICLVFVAENASENTKKRISDKCKFYEKRMIELPLSTEVLGYILGKRGELAVVGLADRDFMNGIEKLL